MDTDSILVKAATALYFIDFGLPDNMRSFSPAEYAKLRAELQSIGALPENSPEPEYDED